MEDLIHITLDTAHVRRSPRHEVGDDVIAMCRGLLTAALTTPGSPVPMPAPFSGYQVCARTAEGALTLDVWRGARLLIRMGVGGGACMVAFGPGFALHPEAAEWLGDFERCMAWAWLERTEGR